MTAAFTPPAGKDILGHPRGLWYLVFAESWERFSYYGMQALLVLYLTQYLLLPENSERVAGFVPFRLFLEGIYGELATPVTLAAAITGLYSAGVYFTPLIGGWLADNYLGQRKSVIIGGLVMAAGQFGAGGAFQNPAAALPRQFRGHNRCVLLAHLHGRVAEEDGADSAHHQVVSAEDLGLPFNPGLGDEAALAARAPGHDEHVIFATSGVPQARSFRQGIR